MRKVSLFLFFIGYLICNSDVASAQEIDYSPLVVEGRTWANCLLDQRKSRETPNYEDGCFYEFYCLTFEGDTIIDGVTYKKLYRYPLGTRLDTENNYPVAYMLESDKKVTVIYNNIHPDFEDDISFATALRWDSDLVYDFNNITSTNSLLANFNEIEPIEIEGKKHKAYCHNNYDWMKIVEGIGIDGDRNYLFYSGPNHMYVSGLARYTMGLSHVLNSDGEIVYCGHWYDYYESITSGINKVNSHSVVTDGKYYDLTGRRVANPSNGIYIKDGKKVIVK